MAMASVARLGEVDGHVEVVVEEGAVLRWVEHLEQRARWVALVAAPQLVDLVNEHDGVGHAHALEGLDELARHRADVGAPVALDLGHVGQSSDGEAEELAVECRGDALACLGVGVGLGLGLGLGLGMG